MRTGFIVKISVTAALITFFISFVGCGNNGHGFLSPGAPSPGSGPTQSGTGDTVPPAVLSTTPGTNAADILINTAISVNFSEYVNQSTVSTTTLLLKDGNGSQVSGRVSCSGTTATFTPSTNLSPNTTYTATVTSAVTDGSGNHLTGDYSWSFTTNSRTDFTAPTVLSTSPASGVTDIALSSSVIVTFSEAMDPSTITATTFYLRDSSLNQVPGVISSSGATATFSPAVSLQRGTSYSACVTTGAADLAGNHLQNNDCWSFSAVSNSGIFKPSMAIATGSWPQAVAIGDVNNDGRNDVVLVTSYYFDPAHDYKLFVFLQDGAGNLSTAATYTTTGTYSSPPSSVAVGDIDNDGKNEVVIGNAGKNIEVFTQNGSGGLVSSAIYTTVNSDKIKIADLNHDGRLDVVGIGSGTNTVDVFLQNATGTLDPPVTYSVTHGGYDDLEVADVNNDGLMDIIIMSGQTYAASNIGVLIQKPDGTFNPPVYYSVGQNILTSGVAVGDVNGDSLNDIVVTYGGNWPSSQIGVFTQNNSGGLNSVASYPAYDCPEPIEIADVTGDGKKDIIVSHGGWDTLGVYVQSADGTLLPEEYYSIPYASHYNPHGLAVGDINSDGLNDAVLADYNHGLVVLYHK